MRGGRLSLRLGGVAPKVRGGIGMALCAPKLMRGTRGKYHVDINVRSPVAKGRDIHLTVSVLCRSKGGCL